MNKGNRTVELESGGEIRLDYQPLPEWASYFTRLPKRCDRCWENVNHVSSEKGSDYHVCRTCRFRYINNSSLSGLEVFKKKFILHMRRAMWNATNDREIPNNPGWR